MIESDESHPGPQPSESDPVLHPYLTAAAESDAAAPLAALFARQAQPIIEQIVRTKRSRGETVSAEADDVASAAREYLLRQLALARAGERSPIRDFRAYVATVTYSAWSEFLRERYPQRAMLLNRLRYLLENRTNQKGFALWDDAEGAKWCGFSTWRERTGAASPKLQWLLVDSFAAAADALPGRDASAMPLPELTAALLRWLGGPIELRDLTNALSELLGYGKIQPMAEDEQALQFDSRQSPEEELIWKEYLAWLWNEIGTLSIRQRSAFLLHFEILRELEVLGIASIRAIATRLELSAEELAKLWKEIPLDDLTIAKMLDCTRQQVINLRRVARDKLGASWRKWSRGNTGAESSSSQMR